MRGNDDRRFEFPVKVQEVEVSHCRQSWDEERKCSQIILIDRDSCPLNNLENRRRMEMFIVE